MSLRVILHPCTNRESGQEGGGPQSRPRAMHRAHGCRFGGMDIHGHLWTFIDTRLGGTPQLVRTNLHSWPPNKKRRPDEGAADTYTFSPRGCRCKGGIFSFNPLPWRERDAKAWRAGARLSRSWVRGVVEIHSHPHLHPHPNPPPSRGRGTLCRPRLREIGSTTWAWRSRRSCGRLLPRPPPRPDDTSPWRCRAPSACRRFRRRAGPWRRAPSCAARGWYR